MLDAYIIEEIKRQEEERRRKEDAARPRLRIEIPQPRREDVTEPADGERDERPEDDSGIIRIDLSAGA